MVELTRLWPRIFAYACSLTEDPAHAEDICQEAFLRLLCRRGSMDRSRSLASLLVRIVRNLLVSSTRRPLGVSLDAMQEDGQELTDENAQDPADCTARREAVQRLHEELSALPPLWRDALLLRIGLDLSYREIAEALGKSEDVIRVTLFRARRRAREILFPDGNEEAP